MTPTELKHAMGHIQDARKTGNPAIQSLAAVCEYLLQCVADRPAIQPREGDDKDAQGSTGRSQAEENTAPISNRPQERGIVSVPVADRPAASQGALPPRGGPFHPILDTLRDTVWIVEQNERVHSVHATRESAMKEMGENLRIGAPWKVHGTSLAASQPATAAGERKESQR